MRRTSRALCRGVATALLVAGEAAALVALFRLGHAPGFALPAHALGHWILHSPTEVLVAAAGRVVGLAAASWLLSATLLSIARRLVPAWRRLTVLDLATPASVRRLLDRTLVVGLGASLAIGGVRPAGATPRAPVATMTRSVAVSVPVDVPVPRVPPGAPAGRIDPVDPPRPAARASPPPAAPPRSAAVVVRPGDNLWAIAQRAVGSDRPAAIAPYWRAIVAANTNTIRSHDPNLIYPGERIVLPAGLPPGSGPTAPPG